MKHEMPKDLDRIFAKLDFETEILQVVLKHLEQYRSRKNAGEVDPRIDLAMELATKLNTELSLAKKMLVVKEVLDMARGR